MSEQSTSAEVVGFENVPIRPRRIAVLTAGGDAPGMNAAIRAVIRSAAAARIDIIGVRRGYEGLIEDRFESMTGRGVANILQRGGTVLETSRSEEFRRPSGRARALQNLRDRNVEGLVVIGGEGALQGATVFHRETGLPLMLVPASIDNDVPGTEYAIGFDTAVNTAIDAIDKVRDTMFAFERVFCIEVMGRDSGFIGLSVAIGAGAEAVVVPEIPLNMDDLCRRVEEARQRGKQASIIVVSEGPRTGGVIPIADQLEHRLGIKSRIVVLGHIQRGGSPSARDRLLASRMGAEAVGALAECSPASVIGEERGEIVRTPLDHLHERQRRLDTSLIDLVYQLSI